MKTALRDLFKLTGALGLIAIACGDTDAEQKALAGLAEGCTLNSDCNQPLVCAFQLCHVQCEESRDCPTGQRCVAGPDDKNVCQLPQETSCTRDSSCKGDQVCATDKECRDPCTKDSACVGDQVCSTSGACAEEDELDANGNLPNASGGSGGGGGTSGGKSGSGGKGGSGGKSGTGGNTGGSENGGRGGTEAGGAGEGGDSGETSSGGDSGEGGSTAGVSGSSSGSSGTSGGGAGGTSGGGAGGTSGGGTSGGGTGGTSGGGAGGTSGGGTSGGGTGGGGAGGSGGAQGCIQAVNGRYMIRTDGRLLLQDYTEQRTIYDAQNAQPLTDVVSVFEGQDHGCALRSDASVYCWPINVNGNAYGQLGDGTQVTGSPYRAVRVRTGSSAYLEGATQVSAGTAYYFVTQSCAVAGGNVWCWGDTTHLLNNGVPQTSIYATRVTTNGTDPLANVIALSQSTYGACAIVDTSGANEVWCWGANSYGEAGTGQANSRVRYPTKVLGVTNPTEVRSTAFATLVLDGTQLKCWGRNDYKECGINAAASSVLAPTLVKYNSGTPVDSILAFNTGTNDACMIRNDQSLWCWGNNVNMGYAAPYGAPTQVADATLLGYATTPAYVSNDGVYHLGPTPRTPNCGLLE